MYKKTVETNTLQAMFGTSNPCTTLFGRFKAFFDKNKMTENDNVNVNVVPFGDDQLYALTESSMFTRLDPSNLDVLNTKNLTKYIKPTFSSIAHPHIDSQGNWISVGMQPKGKISSYDFMKFDSKEGMANACESVKLINRIPSSHKFGLSYFHSFGLSENYIIFLEQSLVFDFRLGLINSIIFNKPFSTCLKMQKDFATKIVLIDRKTGNILPQKWYTDPQFTFHHINAYEANNNVIVDVASYDPKNFHIDNFSYDEELHERTDDFLQRSVAYAKRITIPLNVSADKQTYCQLKEINTKSFIELPTINYAKFNTKMYNYVYGIGSTKPPHSIVKINVNKFNDSIEAVIQSDNDHILPSEPIFVENPEGKEEDDGVLLSLVLGNKYDYLTILDAKTLEEVARAELPESVKATFSFHGFFADNKTYAKLN